MILSNMLEIKKTEEAFFTKEGSLSAANIRGDRFDDEERTFATVGTRARNKRIRVEDGTVRRAAENTSSLSKQQKFVSLFSSRIPRIFPLRSSNFSSSREALTANNLYGGISATQRKNSRRAPRCRKARRC